MGGEILEKGVQSQQTGSWSYHRVQRGPRVWPFSWSLHLTRSFAKEGGELQVLNSQGTKMVALEKKLVELSQLKRNLCVEKNVFVSLKKHCGNHNSSFNQSVWTCLCSKKKHIESETVVWFEKKKQLRWKQMRKQQPKTFPQSFLFCAYCSTHGRGITLFCCLTWCKKT